MYTITYQLHVSATNWPSSGWSTLQEELYNYYNIIIRGETRSRPPPNDYNSGIVPLALYSNLMMAS
jgi:hypothetical protein